MYYSKYDVNDTKVDAREREYEDFDLSSYAMGWDDGLDVATDATIFNMVTQIYEYWDEFINALREYDMQYKREANVIEYMTEWFKLRVCD